VESEAQRLSRVNVLRARGGEVYFSLSLHLYILETNIDFLFFFASPGHCIVWRLVHCDCSSRANFARRCAKAIEKCQSLLLLLSHIVVSTVFVD
jgi:hypothetical protein